MILSLSLPGQLPLAIVKLVLATAAKLIVAYTYGDKLDSFLTHILRVLLYRHVPTVTVFKSIMLAINATFDKNYSASSSLDDDVLITAACVSSSSLGARGNRASWAESQRAWKGSPMLYTAKIANQAGRGGHTNLFHWWHETRVALGLDVVAQDARPSIDELSLANAAWAGAFFEGHVAMLDWIFDNYERVMFDEIPSSRQAQVPVLEWATSKFAHPDWDNEMIGVLPMDVASELGHFDVLEWWANAISDGYHPSSHLALPLNMSPNGIAKFWDRCKNGALAKDYVQIYGTGSSKLDCNTYTLPSVQQRKSVQGYGPNGVCQGQRQVFAVAACAWHDDGHGHDPRFGQAVTPKSNRVVELKRSFGGEVKASSQRPCLSSLRLETINDRSQSI
ncbi:hypothetical protein BCR44DRAFT_398156 [Catenaria anguillulae PL171]|uniref:Uncharacterized protein n=1 Tax=Catenaria anguillulae PL171 TaxID=765915 RepID=A0A1Y2HMM5_9FUNG|nr:hypothetical protein BCR44DRAFT_398156 [Catenaria anguillulae PL171]